MALWIMMSSGHSFAQESDTGWKITAPEYWKGYLSDTVSITTAPSRWETADWIAVSLVIGTTAGLSAFDSDIQRWAQRHRTGTTDTLSQIFTPFGDGRYSLPPLGALYLYGHFSEDGRARKAALLALESFVISGAFTFTIKFASHRHRPSSGDSSQTWDGPQFSLANLSFPSGHSASAYAVATAIAMEYHEEWYVPVLAYSIAAFTALSRINDNAHWASDVFFGSALGVAAAKAIEHAHQERARISFLPIGDGETPGTMIVYVF